jgi:hypothetical protein
MRLGAQAFQALFGFWGCGNHGKRAEILIFLINFFILIKKCVLLCVPQVFLLYAFFFFMRFYRRKKIYFGVRRVDEKLFLFHALSSGFHPVTWERVKNTGLPLCISLALMA